MSVILLVLGLLMTGAGVGMVGFGIPINEFSLGNTMIAAGSTLVAGGMIVLALAATLRQLNRIAALLSRTETSARGRPAVSPVAAPVQAPQGGQAPAPAARVPFPTRRKPEGREPRAEATAPRDPPAPPRTSEPRGAAAGIDTPKEATVSRPLPGLFSGSRVSADAAAVSAIDAIDAELSPRAHEPPMQRAAPEPDVTEPEEPEPPKPEPKFAQRLRSPSPPADRNRPPPPAATRKPPGPIEAMARSAATETASAGFDAFWPLSREGRKAAESKAAGPVATEPQDAKTTDEEPAAEPPRPVAILKSGVVDGMAYTLYTDGSIEAQLAEGVVRFASIEELRSHLEQNG